MTNALRSMLHDSLLRRNQQLFNIIAANPLKKFLYLGSPVPFIEATDMNSLRRTHEKFHSIHKENIEFLLRPEFSVSGNLLFIGAPLECIHPTGAFAFSKFARNFPGDIYHASDSYWRLLLFHMSGNLLRYFS